MSTDKLAEKTSTFLATSMVIGIAMALVGLLVSLVTSDINYITKAGTTLIVLPLIIALILSAIKEIRHQSVLENKPSEENDNEKQ